MSDTLLVPNPSDPRTTRVPGGPANAVVAPEARGIIDPRTGRPAG